MFITLVIHTVIKKLTFVLMTRGIGSRSSGVRMIKRKLRKFHSLFWMLLSIALLLCLPVVIVELFSCETWKRCWLTQVSSRFEHGHVVLNCLGCRSRIYICWFSLLSKTPSLSKRYLCANTKVRNEGYTCRHRSLYFQV